jgi:hypothetical protein
MLLQELTTEVRIYRWSRWMTSDLPRWILYIELMLFYIYTGAQACVIAYSIVDRDSFEAVQDWKGKVSDARDITILKCRLQRLTGKV